MIARFRSLKSNYSRLGTDLKAARGMVSLVSGLREFFREPVSLGAAYEEIRRALEAREQRFLDLVRCLVYERPDSPYLKLLGIAGCDFSDLHEQVVHHGLERTLEKLAAAGVYLTSEEFRGKKPVVRGGSSFQVSSKDFRLEDADGGLVLTQSSGSRNQAHRYAVSLDRMAMLSLSTCVFFSAHDLLRYSHAIYDAILPTSGGIRYLLTFAKFGIAADRWFARRVPMNNWPEAMFHQAMTRAIVLATKTFGPGAPRPEYIDRQEVGRIVDWIVEQKQGGKFCCVRTTASNAVEIARAAQNTGRSLEGASFIVSGEPFTDTKSAVLRAVNARAIPCYGCSGLGQIGYGCANPSETDDVHVPSHGLAVIQHRRVLDDGPAVDAFLFTTVAPFYPLLHFNVENGDYGTMETRDCGCALQQAGLTLHLHHIRSYEKLTSEGMSFFYGNLYDLLERIFPAEFGGGPGDYQLVEEEDRSGQSRVTLVVHPEVGPVDEERILMRLKTALADGSRNNRFMTWVWQDAGTFRIKREIPRVTPRGKILPLQIYQARTRLPDGRG
jgi:hypothetical protein